MLQSTGSQRIGHDWATGRLKDNRRIKEVARVSSLVYK